MISVLAAAVLMVALLTVYAMAIPFNNDSISTKIAAQPVEKVPPLVRNETPSAAPSLTPQTRQALNPGGDELPGPPGSLSFVIYAAVFVTVIALVYLAVRNFRMRYDTARAERYGFRIRRGRTDHEVQPLARDDEDEEILFDVRGNLK